MIFQYRGEFCTDSDLRVKSSKKKININITDMLKNGFGHEIDPDPETGISVK